MRFENEIMLVNIYKLLKGRQTFLLAKKIDGCCFMVETELVKFVPFDESKTWIATMEKKNYA